jgi:hypothetical protein
VFALALALKPTAALAIPSFLILLLWERSVRQRVALWAVAGSVAVGAVFLVAYRDSLGALWESVVEYHRDARDTSAVADNAHELLAFLNWRTPFAWLVFAGLVASAALLRRRHVQPLWALWLWAALSVAFLGYHHPLHDNHLVLLPVVLAVPAGIALGEVARRARRQDLAVGALALVLAAGYVQQQRRVVLDDVPEEPELVRAAELLRRETRPGDLVVSDQPIVPFLADRRVDGPLVDLARLRFATGSLTSADVLERLDRANVAAVVVGRALAEQPRVIGVLRRNYRSIKVGVGVTLYLRR